MALDFFQTYFVNSILQNGWFNPINTIVYSILLIIAVVLVYKLLKKMNIKIDKYFFYAIVPFVFWASSTRVLHDAARAGRLLPELNTFYSSLVFPTPGSYFITFAFAFVTLLVGLGLQKTIKTAYWKVMFVVGTGATLLNLFWLPYDNLYGAGLILGLTAVWIVIFFLASKSFQFSSLKKFVEKHNIANLFSKENQGILAAHMLDASATFISIAYFGYFEQHVLPRAIFPFLGPGSMFLLKLVVLIPVLWIIDNYAEKDEFRTLLKIVVLILGLAPGLRDVIRLGAGV
ncbi:MAG: DUF63 family protein [Candidatus Aenigmatarchaeota archaeon]